MIHNDEFLRTILGIDKVGGTVGLAAHHCDPLDSYSIRNIRNPTEQNIARLLVDLGYTVYHEPFIVSCDHANALPDFVISGPTDYSEQGPLFTILETTLMPRLILDEPSKLFDIHKDRYGQKVTHKITQLHVLDHSGFPFVVADLENIQELQRCYEVPLIPRHIDRR